MVHNFKWSWLVKQLLGLSLTIIEGAGGLFRSGSGVYEYRVRRESFYERITSCIVMETSEPSGFVIIACMFHNIRISNCCMRCRILTPFIYFAELIFVATVNSFAYPNPKRCKCCCY